MGGGIEWAQHGGFSLQWRGDVLLARYQGCWNEVCAQRLHREALALWQQRGSGRPWGLLSDARDWEGATPEALGVWWAFFEDGVRHGMVAVTDVLPSHFHEAMVRALAQRAAAMANYRHSDDVEHALAWLAEQGLSTAD
jgi:hypothetical protein